LFEAVIDLRKTYPSYKKAKVAQTDFFNSLPMPLSKTIHETPVNKADVVARQTARMQWKQHT
jgi:hypothetical protein